MPESPLRHSVDHWYGAMPRRGMAGAGPRIIYYYHEIIIVRPLAHSSLTAHAQKG